MKKRDKKKLKRPKLLHKTNSYLTSKDSNTLFTGLMSDDAESVGSMMAVSGFRSKNLASNFVKDSDLWHNLFTY